MGKSIGEGTFGKVKIATHILTNEKVSFPIIFNFIISNFQVAVKILEKSKI